jgi:hypothetical protein
VGFQEIIKLIQNGENVEAATPNASLRQLDGNIRYLRDLLAAVNYGQAIFIRDATVKSTTLVGQPVYFNSTNAQFEPAVGSVESDATTGFLKTGITAHVVGVIHTKSNSTKADILVHGFSELNLNNAVDGSVAAGVYYLSNADPGKLTATLPPSAVPVLQTLQETATAGVWEVVVNTKIHDFLSDHRHFTYELVAEPAGETAPPAEGEKHTISSPNTGLEGWLPADNAIFDGLAPANAEFGYNISASSLAAIWPPVPVSAAGIYARKDNVYDNEAEPTIHGAELLTNDHVVIDENGIWWMTDCYNEVPWSTTLNTGTETSVSVSVGPNDCPASKDDRLFLQWTQSGFVNKDTAVLSLSPRAGSGLAIYCPNTDTEKTTGHLEIDFSLGNLLDSTDQAGHIVFKEFTDGLFQRGPVVESIKSDSASIAVASNVAQDENGRSYGQITLTGNLDLIGSELPVDTVRLDGVEEEFYLGTLGLGFSRLRSSALRGRIIVPGQVDLPVGTELKIQLTILARAAGTVPSGAFTLAYRRITKPSSLLTPQALPTSDTALTLDAGATVAEDEYYTAESDGFTIAAGDEIFFTLTRPAPDSFAGDLHVLKIRGIPFVS